MSSDFITGVIWNVPFRLMIKERQNTFWKQHLMSTS